MMSRRYTLAAVSGVALATVATSALPSLGDETTVNESAAERNKGIVRRYFEEVWNKGHLDVLDELLAPSYINHTPSTPNPPPGPSGLKPIVAAIRNAFPDLHFQIEDIISTADHAVARTIMKGTHRGDLFGLAPTGRSVAVNQINIERIADGRIVEHWRVTDELTLMRQLGAMR